MGKENLLTAEPITNPATIVVGIVTSEIEAGKAETVKSKVKKAYIDVGSLNA